MKRKRVLCAVILVAMSLLATSGCKRAEFEVSSLQVTPEEIWVGNSATVKASVSNVSNDSGVYTANLMVNEEIVKTFELTLASGQTETISFDLTKNEHGTYTITLDSLTSILLVREPTGLEIIGEMTSALDKVETYQFGMNMTIEGVGTVEGSEFEMVATSNIESATDSANRSTWVDINMILEMPGIKDLISGLSTEIEMHVIILDDDFYVKKKVGDAEIGWSREEIRSEQFDKIWENSVQSQIWLDMVRESSEAEFLGRDQIDDVDCYVVDIFPDTKDLWKAIMQEPGMNLVKEGTELPIEVEETIQGSPFRLWINRDTWLPMKGQIEMTTVLSSDLFPLGLPPDREFELTMLASADLSFQDYNEVIAIEAPLAVRCLLCSDVMAPGVYVIQPWAAFQRGDVIWIYVEVTGFDHQEADSEYEVWLNWQHFKLYAPDGEIIRQRYDLHEAHGTIAEEMEPVSFWLMVGTAGSSDPLGQYSIEVKVEDKLSGETAIGRANFTLE